MSRLEGALLAVGRAVVTRVVAAWQGDRAARRERSADLVDLLEPGFADLFARRRLARDFETVVDQVAARLNRTFGTAGCPSTRSWPRWPRWPTRWPRPTCPTPPCSATTWTARLARRLREGAVDRVRAAGLGDAATAFYYRVLDDCAGCLVGLVLQLPAFPPRAAAETLAGCPGWPGS